VTVHGKDAAATAQAAMTRFGLTDEQSSELVDAYVATGLDTKWGRGALARLIAAFVAEGYPPELVHLWLPVVQVAMETRLNSPRAVKTGEWAHMLRVPRRAVTLTAATQGNVELAVAAALADWTASDLAEAMRSANPPTAEQLQLLQRLAG
jgi:hypothetical protein